MKPEMKKFKKTSLRNLPLAVLILFLLFVPIILGFLGWFTLTWGLIMYLLVFLSICCLYIREDLRKFVKDAVEFGCFAAGMVVLCTSIFVVIANEKSQSIQIRTALCTEYHENLQAINDITNATTSTKLNIMLLDHAMQDYFRHSSDFFLKDIAKDSIATDWRRLLITNRRMERIFWQDIIQQNNYEIWNESLLCDLKCSVNGKCTDESDCCEKTERGEQCPDFRETVKGRFEQRKIDMSCPKE